MAIRDQGYTLYEGDLTKGAHPAWVIASNEFMIHWGYLRTKLLFIAMMLVPVLFVLAGFAERAVVKSLMGGAAQADKITGVYEYAFGWAQIWMLALMLAAAGCGVIADDMRYRTIQLYFSKPITRLDYAMGKFLSLALLGGLVVLLPFALVGGVRGVLFAPSENFTEVLANLGMLLVFDVALLSFFCLLVMGLSCLTPRRGFVVLMWLGGLVVPSIVAAVAGVVRQDSPWTDLLSLTGVLTSGLAAMVGYNGVPQPGQVAPPPAPDYMVWAPWVIVLVLAGIAAAVVQWRINKLEGIA